MDIGGCCKNVKICVVFVVKVEYIEFEWLYSIIVMYFILVFGFVYVIDYVIIVIMS